MEAGTPTGGGGPTPFYPLVEEGKEPPGELHREYDKCTEEGGVVVHGCSNGLV